MERIEIIRDLRLGAFDVLVGINLLREGLDIPECALVAILDADKEGFLRSRDLADPDHRPRRAQHRRPRHPLCRPGHRLDGARHGRDQPPPREAGGLQRGNGITPESIKQVDRRHPGQRLRARPRAGRRPAPASAGDSRTPPPSATTSRPCSPISKRACATPPPISTSRRPRGCATRSSACAPPSSRWSTTRPRRWSKLPVEGQGRVTPAQAASRRDGHRALSRGRAAPPRRERQARGPAQADARRDGPGPESKPYRPGSSAGRARPPAAPACTAAGSRGRVKVLPLKRVE